MLMTNGIHPDIALSLGRAERFAYYVAIGEQNGGSFNWDTLKWEKQA